MSIATAITNLQGKIANAYTAIENKGGTLPATQDAENLSATINAIPSGGGSQPVWGINALSDVCYTDANGTVKMFGGASGNLTFTGVKKLNKGYEVQGAFLANVTSMSFPDLETIETGANSLYQACYINTSLTAVSFPKLSAITKANKVFYQAFQGTSLTTISFPELVDITQDSTNDSFMRSICRNCTSLTTISFPKLSSLVGGATGQIGVFTEAFYGCTSLTTVEFPQLKQLKNGGFGHFYNAFNGCTSLTSLSFPELSSINNVPTSGNNAVFYNANTITKIYLPKLTVIDSGSGTTLNGTKLFGGCTNLVEIHFAEANQTLIESASGYATKWGAPNANCQIYFDL